MKTIAITLGLALAGLALVGLAVGAFLKCWRRLSENEDIEEEEALWSIRAYSFQSELSFSDAKRILEAGGLGEWYERDSAWYDQLLSCRGRAGVWMNLYRKTIFRDSLITFQSSNYPVANFNGK